MNILFFSLVNLNYASGFDRMLLDIIESPYSSIDKITVFTSNYGIDRVSDSYIHKKLNGKADFFRARVFKLKNIPLPSFSFIKLLYSKIKCSDVVYYVFGFIFYDLLLLFFKLLLRKKVIISFHAPLFIENNPIHNVYLRTMLRMTLKYYDKIHTINKEDTVFFKLWGHEDKVVYIPNGINIDRFLSIPIVDRQFLYDKLRFAFVGRLEKQKSVDLLTKVIPKLENFAVDFYFAGSGSFEREVKELSSSCSFVKYLGFLDFDNIDRIYSQADILLLPSRQEPFGIVIIEALASGMPVIASKERGPLDLLEEGKTGWFISDVSEGSIYAKILEVYDKWVHDKAYLRDLSFQCREAAKNFTIDHTIALMRKNFFT